MPDDRILALCELSNDLMFTKIPQDRLAYYVDSSLQAGRDAALKLSGKDIFELYSENNIRIKYHESGSGAFGVVLRAQTSMSEKECYVDIYKASINELAGCGRLENGFRLDYSQALALHLAHEFFHLIEYKTGGFVSEKLESVVTASFLGFERRSKLNRCSEIAAHAFAKDFLRLPCLPNYFDYLYLIETGKLAQADFNAKLQRMGELL